jgi:hypothetical protein
MNFVWQGDTDEPFDAANVGCCDHPWMAGGGRPLDGPGLEGESGLGTWIEPVFDLSRFRGQRLRLRFLVSGIALGGAETWWDQFGFPPEPTDDGWWIDDVTLSGTLTLPATLAVDTKDNSLLPGLTDPDGDGLFCDNCPSVSNPAQLDLDGDLAGDVCDADRDGDGVANGTDNCPDVFNVGQPDLDNDGLGDDCDPDLDGDSLANEVDNCPFDANVQQLDLDADGVGDPCDNCVAVPNDQTNVDGDPPGDACDNCPTLFNPSQIDRDADAEGDLCDLNDSLIYLTFPGADTVSWQEELGMVGWNFYSGDLEVLKSSGIYTQAPGSNPLATQHCGLNEPLLQDPVIPGAGQAAFYLVSGRPPVGDERLLGSDSTGNRRTSTNPCP